MQTRIAIVEDDPKYRAGLETLLPSDPSFRVVDAFPSALPLLAKAEAPDAVLSWDLVIMDLGLPDLSGIEAIRRLKHRWPDLPVVTFTVFEDPARILDAICAGADGYLLKRTPARELIAQMHVVVEGGSPLTPGVARSVLEIVRRGEAAPGPSSPSSRIEMSTRELDVLRLLAEGFVYKQAADQLGLSVETVRTYVRRIYRKMQVKTAAEAVSHAIREKLI